MNKLRVLTLSLPIILTNTICGSPTGDVFHCQDLLRVTFIHKRNWDRERRVHIINLAALLLELSRLHGLDLVTMKGSIQLEDCLLNKVGFIII